VPAGLERCLRDVIVSRSGNDDRDCVDISKERSLALVTFHAELAFYLGRPLATVLDESRERDALHVAENSNVMKSKAARADDADPQLMGQMTTPRPLASTKRMSSRTSGYISSSVSAARIAWERLRSERKNSLYARFSSRTTGSENPLR